MAFNITNYFEKIDVLDKGSVELIDGMVSHPLLKVVNSARVSFNKTSEKLTERDYKLIKFLHKHGHYSTFRHSYFSFRIVAPLFVFRQWWKYQVGSDWLENDGNVGSIEIHDTSWNEASGRYVLFKPEFHMPQTFRLQSKDNKQGSYGEISEIDGVEISEIYKSVYDQQYRVYEHLTKSGVAKEQARMVLPQSIYSECIWTCSLQTLMLFFEQRLKSDAQFEIREYATAVYQLIKPLVEQMYESELKEGEVKNG